MSTLNDIFVNQIGYCLNGTKFAYVRGAQKGDEFSLVDEKGKAVFSGKLKAPVKDRVADEDICTADFSAFCVQGTYSIKAGKNQSVAFTIGDGLYGDLYYSILRYFTLSRCG